jgi:Raf kinase inhibitor-like YbhB/YbcL family protein
MSRKWMRRGLMMTALIATLASCGAKDEASNQTSGGNAVENATLTKFTLTSDAFQEGQPIPARFSCDGDDRSPALKWGEPPEGTKSLALIVDDPDAPSGLFRHWGAYDIPAIARELPAGASPPGEAQNDFGKPGYGGPCPPHGHGPHRYRFKLLALDVDRLNLSNPKVAEVEAEAEKYVVGRAQLTGTYERR